MSRCKTKTFENKRMPIKLSNDNEGNKPATKPPLSASDSLSTGKNENGTDQEYQTINIKSLDSKGVFCFNSKRTNTSFSAEFERSDK